jgi:quinoprotein glucose dehydrogenase
MCLALVLLLQLTAFSQAGWPVFGHDSGGSRFSTLKQITPENVTKLQRVWTYHHAEGTGRDVRGSFQVTPLVVDGAMYLSTPSNTVVALEPETGKEIWRFVSKRAVSGRGVAYWSGDKTTGTRILFGDAGGFLNALDAKTGKPAAGFGTDGAIDANDGTGKFRYSLTNPGIIYKGVIIFGAQTGESNPGGRGDTHAYDLRTGKLVWTFHNVPLRGEPGFETWPDDESVVDRSGANTWSYMALDVERGLVFFPTGSASYDFNGEDRHGANLYTNSLVALDAATGKLKWYRQLVHHDIWDYDIPAGPNLIEVTKNGRRIPAIAQITKMGLVFIFDRVTGEPLFGMEERKVPQSEIPGEKTWPTQPFPVKPVALGRMAITRDQLSKVTPEHQVFCADTWDKNKVYNDGPYTPLGSNGTTLWFPSTIGGPNWGGASYNPAMGYLVVNLMNLGALGKLVRQPEGAPYSYTVRNPIDPSRNNGPQARMTRFWDPATLMPCNEPPWGELVAINVNTGGIVWKTTLGITEALGEKGLHTGAPNLGGSIATASGLVFIGATNDRRFRAFDARTGKELWTAELDASGNAIPITYQGADGRQYVVIAAGGGGHIGGNRPVSDSLVAFALPR